METTDQMPPLDLDLNSVDTSMPLINGGEIVDFIVAKVEKKKTADGKADFLALDLKSTSVAKGLKGDDLQPGVHVYDNVMLAPTGKATWDMVVKNIASVTQGAGIATNLNDFLNGGFSSLQGASVRAKVGYTPEGPDKKGVHRRAKNEIALYIKQ